MESQWTLSEIFSICPAVLRLALAVMSILLGNNRDIKYADVRFRYMLVCSPCHGKHILMPSFSLYILVWMQGLDHNAKIHAHIHLFRMYCILLSS